MKIYVITRHSIINHGSILQAYATQKFFENLGYKCEIIDYVNSFEKFPNYVKSLLNINEKWNKDFIHRLIYKLVKYPSYYKGYFKFKKYRKKLLTLTNEMNSIEDLNRLDFKDSILCSGSDQLWGPLSNGSFDDAYFLNFGEKTPKFAYSSSIGRKVEFDDRIKGYLSAFNFITTREKTSTNYIKSFYSKEIATIYDPTLMLKNEFWEDFISNYKLNGEYILVYKIHDNPSFDLFIKKFSKEKKLKIRRIINSYEELLLRGKSEFLVSPHSFLTLIKNAKYILTDSFHCTQFSIIFNKKFLVFSPGVTNVRINDFLSDLNLQYRIIDNHDSDSTIIDEQINYNLINKKINDNREIYTKYIYQNLNKIKRN